MTQKEAVTSFLKRSRKYIDGATLTDMFGPGALRALRRARSEGANISVRKQDGSYQYRFA